MGKSKPGLRGGHLSLDFVNTVSWRLSENPKELLGTPEDLIQWAKKVGILKREMAASWKQAAVKKAEHAESLRLRAIELRELCYRLFESLMREARPSRRDLSLLNQYVRDLSGDAVLQWTANGFVWKRQSPLLDPSTILDPILRSATEILTSDLARNVAQCEDDRGCGWLFLNRSRSKARRWCSMSDCGNRAKAKRHYYSKIQRLKKDGVQD